MPNNAWSHLPNAVHIDRILESLRTHPDRWSARYDSALRGSVSFNDAWLVAEGIIQDSQDRLKAWHAAKDEACCHVNVVWSAYYVARDSFLALLAWDHSAALLDIPLEAVRVLAGLGDDAAILLLPSLEVLCEI